MRELRAYQKDAIKSIYDVIREGLNPLCYIATGGGKTFIFSQIVKDAKSKNRKILVVVNKLILIENTIKEFDKIGITSSIYCGKKKKITDITVGTIQSLYKIKENEFNVVIFDEGHRFDISGNQRLKTFLSTFKNTIFLTFTATPWREGEYIYGNDKFWKLAYKKDLKSLTEEKFLVPIVYQNQNKESVIDCSHVKKDSEDYVLSALQDEIMSHEDKIKLQVEDALEKSKDRKKIVVITTGIDHCFFVHSLLGDQAAIIHSKLSEEERNKNLDEFNSEKKRILVSVLIVSEGYDNPLIDCVWFFRPTKSPTLYIQAAGRGLRISEGKSDCLFLDYGNVVNELGSIYDVKLKKDKKEKSSLKIECPICDRIYFHPRNECECKEHTFTRSCLYCGETLPVMDACSCGGGIESRTKNLTVKSYEAEQDAIKINNPSLDFCMHQGPKQEVLLCKIKESILSQKSYYYYIPHFKMEILAKDLGMGDYKNLTLFQIEQFFKKIVKFIILKRNGKYYKPVAFGLENSTYFLK